MSSSWTQNYYHCVYGTKHRTPWITPDLEPRIHSFLGGIAKDLNCTPIAINGMPEHVHILLRFPSDLAISDLIRHLKSRSSKWIHQTFPTLAEFGWQEGYGGFTVSKPNTSARRRTTTAPEASRRSTSRCSDAQVGKATRTNSSTDDAPVRSPSEIQRREGVRGPATGGLLGRRGDLAAPPATIVRTSCEIQLHLDRMLNLLGSLPVSSCVGGTTESSAPNCQSCGYSLEGLRQLICPECSTKYIPPPPPLPPLTFRSPVARAHVVCSIATILCAFVTIGAPNWLPNAWMYPSREIHMAWGNSVAITAFANLILFAILVGIFPRRHRTSEILLAAALCVIALLCAAAGLIT